VTRHARTERDQTVRRGDIPLSEYALIGDGRTAALVARDGSVDWLCHGRFDGAAVFCRLLDADLGGYFQVAPFGSFEADRRYLGNTNVLQTQFECATGRIRLTDAMALELAGEPTLIRRVEGLSGDVDVRVDFHPTFDFAHAATNVELAPGGCSASGSGQRLFLSCPAPMRRLNGGATATFRLAAGETRWLVLTHGSPPLGETAAECAIRSTLRAWERWSARGNYIAPYGDLLRRSALVLKLLIHAPTGAMVAAPTTSLPEDPGGARNWDYRFTWLRDASWLVSALMDLGHHAESMAFLGWLDSLELTSKAPSVFYDLDGKPPLEERELPHLQGYCGSKPVRVGNAAAGQDQHDLLGEVVSAIHLCSDAMPSMQPLDARLWELVTALADRAAAYWAHADRGIWEVRDAPRHFVSSKLLCWTAIDRALTIARRDGLPGNLERWADACSRIRHAILTEGFDEDAGVFRRAFGESGLDAALLLLPRYGFLPAHDIRVVRTTEAIRKRLSTAGLVRRYDGPDGLSGTEGAFIPCSFWLVDCLACQGNLDQARAIFDQVVAHASDLGLLSEEIEVESGRLLGNFPQAFTHLALIRAAISVGKAEGCR